MTMHWCTYMTMHWLCLYGHALVCLYDHALVHLYNNVFGGQRKISGVSLRSFYLAFWDRISHWPEICLSRLGLVATRTQIHPPVSTFPRLGLQVYATTSDFLSGFEVSGSGPHAGIENSSPDPPNILYAYSL